MGYHEHKHLALKNVRCAVLIISDSRTEADDESGAYLKKRIVEEGHQVGTYAILKNDWFLCLTENSGFRFQAGQVYHKLYLLSSKESTL